MNHFGRGMSSTQWDLVGGGFCENLINGFPEYANAISSWFITLIGLWGLFMSTHNSHILRWIYSLYSWAGIGSFLFHWYGFKFYGHLDVVPLLISSWLLVYEGWRIIIHKICWENIRYNTFIDKMFDFLSYCCSFALVFTLSVRVVSGEPWGVKLTFTQLFSIPQLISACTLPVIYIQWRNDREIETRRAFRYMLIGFLVTVGSAVIWLSTEPYCKVRDESGDLKYPIIQYLYTHAIWHIGIIWGAHIILQSVVYFDILGDNYNPHFIIGHNCFTRVILTLFPIVSTD